MRKYKVLAAMTMATMLAIGLCGCTTFDNFKAAFIDKPSDTKSTVTIGVYEPMSGADKAEASLEVEGIELAHEVYPNVNGKIIELEYADNNSDIDAATTAIETLIAEKPAVILGSNNSVYSLVAANYIEEAKIPTIAITNSNPLVTKHYDYYFRVCYVDSNQGDLLARYALNNRLDKEVGILIPEDDDAALAMASEFSDRITVTTETDDAIRCYETYKAGSKDFKNQLRAVKKSGVKTVLIAGNEMDAANIINQAANMNMDVQFIGGTTWASEEFHKTLASNVKSTSVAFLQFFSADSDHESEEANANRKAFLDAYHAKHGDNIEPEDAVALGFDAYLTAVNAINIAGEDADGPKIASVLKDPLYTVDGASGQLKFSSIGDPIKTAYVMTWTGDSMVTIYTVNPEE